MNALKFYYNVYMKRFHKPENHAFFTSQAIFLGEHIDAETVAVHIITTRKRLKDITEEEIEGMLGRLPYKFALAPIKPANVEARRLAEAVGFRHLTNGDNEYYIYGRELNG